MAVAVAEPGLVDLDDPAHKPFTGDDDEREMADVSAA